MSNSDSGKFIDPENEVPIEVRIKFDDLAMAFFEKELNMTNIQFKMNDSIT